MANYYATARSNYFHVTDVEDFKARMEKLGVSVWDEGDGLVGIHTADLESGWPSFICGYDKPGYNEEDYWEEGIDIESEVAKFLVDGEVAVLVEVGNEDLRYVIGYACAINSRGERFTISIDDIMEHAYKLAGEGVEVTNPSD